MKHRLAVFSLAALFCLVLGCRDKEARAKLGDYEAIAEAVQQNKAVVKQWTSESV